LVIENGQARKRIIEIGHHTETEAEILSGLSESEEIILHPSNQVRDGLRARTS